VERLARAQGAGAGGLDRAGQRREAEAVELAEVVVDVVHLRASTHEWDVPPRRVPRGRALP